jgi:serine/threonine protein kinase
VKYCLKGDRNKLFVVEEVSTKSQMVLKLLQLGVKGSVEFNRNLEAVKTAIQIWMKLGSLCKFLVHLYKFFVEDDYCCVIMEFCSGGDLEKIFNEKNRIPQPVSFFYFKDYKIFII